MNILIVQRFDLSSVSCARRVLSQARELASRGHSVTLVDFPNPERPGFAGSGAIQAHEDIQVIPLSRKAIDIPGSCRRLANLDPKPDIVHLWKSYPDAALPALYACDRFDVPLHYDWDDWEPSIARELTGSSLAAHVTGRWDRALCRICDTCSVASSELRKTALEWGMNPEQLFDAPVGADLELFHPRPPDPGILEKIGGKERPVLVYAGQLEVTFYADQAVDMLRILDRKGIQALLLIVGGGSHEEDLKRHAEEQGVLISLYCTGYVSGDEVPRWLSIADVALAPFEDTLAARCKSPLKIAEYLAMALPIVASDVGDVLNMVQHAGFIIPAENPEMMAICTAKILKDTDLCHSMSLAARKRAEERYNWKWHTDQLEAAYRKAIHT
ncbi:MAG TPA: glycosyltransferase family 4 protein [bacterium]|mgnify:FL=1|nr:glycosyltransferase family 4 protein [bacterium]